MRNPVRTYKKKFDGTAKAPWDGDLVDATDHWLAVAFLDPPAWPGRPEGTRYAMTCYSITHPLCVLVVFDERGEVIQYQCDAGLPATINGREITFVDLDLDVMADGQLNHHLRDEDDFAVHRISMSYTDDAIAAAWEGVRIARELIAAREYPFDGTPSTLLGKALAAQGPL